MNYIEDLLPKLGQIIAEDFRNPQTELSEVFEDYVFLFDVIYKALSLPDEGQKEVEEAIEEFIQLRQDGEWDTPKGLVYRIRDIVQRDVLPKLAQMMAKDFSDFSDEWEDVLKTYTEVFKWLNEVLRWKAEDIEETAVEIIERYIEERGRGFKGNEWFPAYGWLAYQLGEMFYELMEELRMNVYDPERQRELQ